ncbi:MAG: CoA pyrophosphatase [Dehalococcoidia bacterium]|nr:CoA pyrophosphatase [Dehalococcoidia bacterium]
MIKAFMLGKEQIKRALASRQKLIIVDSSLTDAAVLLPIFVKGGRCHIVFTKRTEHLHHHSGQISFPGGGRHSDDESLLETALRESREEIGLKESDVEILGELDDAATVTSLFRITPFVGVIPYPYKFKRDKFEVEEIFALPLEGLMHKAAQKEEKAVYGDKIVKVYTYELDGRVIWGATAWILNQFLEILRAVESGAHCQN